MEVGCPELRRRAEVAAGGSRPHSPVLYSSARPPGYLAVKRNSNRGGGHRMRDSDNSSKMRLNNDLEVTSRE